MPIMIKHEYAGSIYNSAYEANKAAVQDMMVDVDIDYLDDYEDLAQELVDQGFELPAFDTDVDHIVSLIEEIVEDHYHKENE